MSLRRDSERHRSRIDRQQPSPKRSRRDEKPDQDPLPRDPVPESATVTKEMENKTITSKHTFFQHDDRGIAGQVGRSSSRQATNERGWRRDPKDRYHESTVNRGGRSDAQQKDDKSQAWKHDGYYQMEADPPLPPPPPRRRPAFSERKISSDSDNAKKVATEERGRHDRHFHSHRPERSFAGDRRPSYLAEAPRGGRTREGYVGDNYNEKSSARQGYFRSGDRVNKWKHDLFDEANRSPTRKHEEDQIAKAEALLLSL